MTTQLVLVLVAVGVGLLVVGAVAVVGIRRSLRRMEAAGHARALTLAGSAPAVLVEPRALCFGFESKGATQLRGNGCLALTADRLVFAMWVPARDVVIQRGDILAVDTATSHLGKTQLTPLLRARFRTPGGGEDVVVWRLANLEPWLAELAAESSAPALA